MIFVGDKFYTIIGDDVYVIRVTKVNNDKITVMMNDKTFNINRKDLLEKYTKLNQHGNIVFTIVELQNGMKDVMCSFFTAKEIEEKSVYPHAICRQSMENIYLTYGQLMIKDNRSQVSYVGLSVNIDNCPQDFEFQNMLLCNKVVFSRIVSVYIDDTLDDIINLVPKRNKFDILLEELQSKFLAANIYGASNSLRGLIEDTGFMGDILLSLNAISFNGIIQYDENMELMVEQRNMLEKYVGTEMYRTYTIKYGMDIDLDNIQRTHVIVKDSTETVYIIAYDQGKDIPEYIKERERLLRDLKQQKIALGITKR